MAKAKAKVKTAKKAAAKKPAAKQKTAPKTATRKSLTPGWIDAGKGYELGIRDGKLVARKDGKQLGSVPKPVKDGPLGERLASAIDFLEEHERTCTTTVETSIEAAGLDKQKGIGVVNRDGETVWLDTENVLLPHPILLDEIDDLRAMAVEINVKQGLQQLFRETFVVPKTAPSDPLAVEQFSGGEFAMLNTAINLAKRLGYRVSGGASICRVLERGKLVEARYDLGDGDPMYETTTGDLSWVDDKQKQIAVVDVPPVAYSEGMRMASQIYAKRKVEESEDDDA